MELNILDIAITTLLRDKRKKLCVPMLEIARCLDKTHGFIGLVESGKRSLSVGELEIYCNVLCVKMEDVIAEAKKKVMFQFDLT
ncbi:helix-turn-helix transcriptional regulator [uncultured Psychrosphaera sp.]|uniref:helix-turn-helix domain-containing protein n=1 Tax=uncultured Psychrosphaera sp. TaxID=1403522 RepID=UPI002612F7A6|nr:helix-turn-helix transcriptional regulator [uncultured Psychrosphaera sp.]